MAAAYEHSACSIKTENGGRLSMHYCITTEKAIVESLLKTAEWWICMPRKKHFMSFAFCMLLGIICGEFFLSADELLQQSEYGRIFLSAVPGVILFFFFTLAMELNEKFYEVSTVDNLTGINNRKGFQGEIKKFVAAKKREIRQGKLSDRQFLSLLMFDVDNFKEINSHITHAGGNYVLVEVAKTIMQTMRTEEPCARIGGDEFVAAVVVSDKTFSLIPARRVEKAVKRLKIEYSGVKIEVSVTAGIYSIPLAEFDCIPFEELLKEASKMMLNLKEKKNKFSMNKFPPESVLEAWR